MAPGQCWDKRTPTDWGHRCHTDMSDRRGQAESEAAPLCPNPKPDPTMMDGWSRPWASIRPLQGPGDGSGGWYHLKGHLALLPSPHTRRKAPAHDGPPHCVQLWANHSLSLGPAVWVDWVFKPLCHSGLCSSPASAEGWGRDGGRVGPLWAPSAPGSQCRVHGSVPQYLLLSLGPLSPTPPPRHSWCQPSEMTPAVWGEGERWPGMTGVGQAASRGCFSRCTGSGIGNKGPHKGSSRAVVWGPGL